jgi:hypothetical protein
VRETIEIFETLAELMKNLNCALNPDCPGWLDWHAFRLLKWTINYAYGLIFDLHIVLMEAKL